MNGSENPLAERPGETLLGAEDHQRGSDRSPGLRRVGGGQERQRPSDRELYRLRVAVDGDQSIARLLRPSGGYAAHRVHHRAELADAADPRGDVGQAVGHAGLAGERDWT